MNKWKIEESKLTPADFVDACRFDMLDTVYKNKEELFWSGIKHYVSHFEDLIFGEVAPMYLAKDFKLNYGDFARFRELLVRGKCPREYIELFDISLANAESLDKHYS